MGDYIIQKAVGLDKVVKKNQRPLEELERTFEAQRKYDGCCAVMFFPPEGGTYTKSRTGEENFALAPLERIIEAGTPVLRKLLGGFVLIGEAWHPSIPFNEISGEFRRYAESSRLWFVVNDCLTWEEFHAGYSDVPYAARRIRYQPTLDAMQKFATNGRVYCSQAYAPGTYKAQALCNDLVKAGGYDGLVLRDLMGTWRVGGGTTGEIIKIKRVLSFDLRCTGVFEGKGKHAGRMGGIIVDFRGKELRVGTGFTDAEREVWWGPDTHESLDIINQIVEIEAMDYSSDGLLREPRFKSVRFDKTEPDA